MRRSTPFQSKEAIVSFDLSLPADSDGFVAFQCPHSGDRFKLSGTEYEERSPSAIYCPLCGLSEELSAFLTDDALRVARQAAANAARELISRELANISRRSSRNGLTFRLGARARPELVEELHEPNDLVVAAVQCCGIHVKVDSLGAIGVLYCPYCGSIND
jgi:hypothetical protein